MAVDANVLYHSLLEMASGEEFGATLPKSPFSSNCLRLPGLVNATRIVGAMAKPKSRETIGMRFSPSEWRNGRTKLESVPPTGPRLFGAFRMLLHLLEIGEITRYFGTESHT